MRGSLRKIGPLGPLMMLVLASGAAFAQPERTDQLGDPLPKDARLRIGSTKSAAQLPGDFPKTFSLRGAVLSADGKRLATYGEPADAAAERLIQVWELPAGKLLWELKGHQHTIQDISISPDGKMLVSTSFDDSDASGTTRVWDLTTGQARHLILEGGEFVRFAPDGGRFWLAIQNKLLAYHIQTGQEVQRFLGPNRMLDITPDGRFAVANSHIRDPELRLFDLHNHNKRLGKLERLNENTSTTGAPVMVRFSPDGRTIAVVDRSADVLVWETQSRRLVHQLKGHKGRVFALAFSPDGKFLVTGGVDKTVRVWEIATGKEIHQQQGHAGIVTVLGFSQRTRQLVSGSTDRTALVWNTSNSLVSHLKIPPLTEDALTTLWHQLAMENPTPVYLAMGMITKAEEKTLPFFFQKMEGILIPSKNNRIEELIKDLSHRESRVRNRATKELRKLRTIAQPLLIKVLKESELAEVRARLRYILNGSNNVTRFSATDKLRMQQLIQLAEQTKSPTSLALLELLSQECPVPPIAQEAANRVGPLEGFAELIDVGSAVRTESSVQIKPKGAAHWTLHRLFILGFEEYQ